MGVCYMPYLAAGLEGVDYIGGELDGAATVLSGLALCLSVCRLPFSFFPLGTAENR